MHETETSICALFYEEFSYGILLNLFTAQNIDAICNDVDELIKQVIQSNSSRPPDVFYDFCLKLFDRVYGENTTLCETQPGALVVFLNMFSRWHVLLNAILDA